MRQGEKNELKNFKKEMQVLYFQLRDMGASHQTAFNAVLEKMWKTHLEALARYTDNDAYKGVEDKMFVG